MAEAEAGRLVLGGCLIGLREPDPTDCCTSCGAEFDRATGAVYLDGSSEAQYFA